MNNYYAIFLRHALPVAIAIVVAAFVLIASGQVTAAMYIVAAGVAAIGLFSWDMYKLRPRDIFSANKRPSPSEKTNNHEKQP